MHPSSKHQSRLVIFGGLGISLVIAVLLSPFASKNPDGLDRVAQDLAFESKAHSTPIAAQMPFAKIFDEYALQGVPAGLATPLAGLAGTIATFGLAWGLGKVAVRGVQAETDFPPSDRD